MSVKVQAEDFDMAAQYHEMRQLGGKVGAIVSFSGLVRDYYKEQTIEALSLEHYPGMTENVLKNIEDEARKRWDLLDVLIIHRVGKLLADDQIVLVLVASAHRADAFEACEFLMDFLKTKAPFWKKEHTPQGAQWVDAKESDESAALRWNQS